MSLKWRAYWVLVVLMLALYLTMILWSLPFISENAGGLMPFDMRPAGYDLADVQEFLGVLTPNGKAFYLGIQHWFDTFYPAMLAAVLAVGGLGFARGRWKMAAYVLVGAAVAGAVADYVENAYVAQMLVQDVNSLNARDVESAAYATLLKSGLTTVAMILFLFLLLLRSVKYLRTGKDGN